MYKCKRMVSGFFLSLSLKWDDAVYGVNHWMDMHPKTSLSAILVLTVVATNLFIV